MRRDDKVHDSLIEERIGRERPCRTLFIRNIKVNSKLETIPVRETRVNLPPLVSLEGISFFVLQ